MSRLEDYFIKKYKTIDSTQEEAKRLIDQGEIHQGTILVAQHQINGHGKANRIWNSSDSDITMTILLKPEVEAKSEGQICYIAALAVARSIQTLSPDLNIQFKWVNDILINDKKVGGILLEKVKYGFILVGIGVNLKHSPNLVNYNATSLQEHDVSYDYEQLISSILNNFKTLYNTWLDTGFSIIKNKWLSQARGLNSALKVNIAEKSIEGIFIGIDDEDGSLLLLSGSEVKAINAGEVFF